MIIPRRVVAVAEKVGGKAFTKVQKFSPEILTAAGVVGFVATAVLAAKATLKLEDKIDKINNDIYEVNEYKDGNKKELSKVYVKGAFEITKLYLPTISVGLLSATSIVAAHGIMNRRQAGLVAAYAVLEKGFEEYRKRVIDEFGEEKDREFRSGIVFKKNADGTTSQEAEEYIRTGLSDYQRIFGRENQYWSENSDFNVFFLTAQQNIFNNKLQARGHVFLNEVLDALGFEHTPAGSVVGWVKNSETGDGFIDFGADKWENIVYGAHYDGQEGHILLEFNVDGPIWNKI